MSDGDHCAPWARDRKPWRTCEACGGTIEWFEYMCTACLVAPAREWPMRVLAGLLREGKAVARGAASPFPEGISVGGHTTMRLGGAVDRLPLAYTSIGDVLEGRALIRMRLLDPNEWTGDVDPDVWG